MKFDRKNTKRKYYLMSESTFPILLLPRCYGNVGSVVVVPSDPTIRLSDKDFQFVKDDINWVKYSLLLVTIAPPILMLKIQS